MTRSQKVDILYTGILIPKKKAYACKDITPVTRTGLKFLPRLSTGLVLA